MITRKLNALQINKVFEAVNNGSLVSASIFESKRQKGVYMISYETDTRNIVKSRTPKSQTTIEFMRVLKEIRTQVIENSYISIDMTYDAKKSIFTYSLNLKEQG